MQAFTTIIGSIHPGYIIRLIGSLFVEGTMKKEMKASNNPVSLQIFEF